VALGFCDAILVQKNELPEEFDLGHKYVTIFFFRAVLRSLLPIKVLVLCLPICLGKTCLSQIFSSFALLLLLDNK
jgi:hypothetical protein